MALSDSRFAKLIGLTAAKRQIAQLPEIVRVKAFAPIQASTNQMAADAQAAAPRRSPDALPGYSGGALRSHIAGRVSKKHLIGIVGIERGAVVVVGGTSHTVNTTKRVKYRRRKADGTYADAYRRRVIGGKARARIAARGGRVVQPTKYGHLMEFEFGRSFLRPAARRQQSAFEAGLRGVSPDVIAALRAAGTGGAA
jgi:biotin carboxyl carrier protein